MRVTGGGDGRSTGEGQELLGISRLAHDLQTVTLEETGHPLPQEHVVVGHDHASGSRHASIIDHPQPQGRAAEIWTRSLGCPNQVTVGAAAIPW